MSTMGPELPPHLLAKRKRQMGDGNSEKPATLPATSSEPEQKRKRTIGPAAPPNLLSEKPSESPAASLHEEGSDSDDDYGPAPSTVPQPESTTKGKSEDPNEVAVSEQGGSKRDSWMMIPPEEDGLAARMDPTRARPRKFNTGKGSRAPNHGDGIDASWTETPEEKRKRLADEVMGVEKAKGTSALVHTSRREEENANTAKKIQEHSEKTRGRSLYEEHQRGQKSDKEDDPSKRAFDREKDIAGGMRIGHAQRKEMLNRASGFGSRFSGGGYL